MAHYQDKFDARHIKYPIPQSGIHDEPHVMVPLNVEWIPFLMGLLPVLEDGQYWIGDPQHAIQQMQYLRIALLGTRDENQYLADDQGRVLVDDQGRAIIPG